jgi:hypothetical protein
MDKLQDSRRILYRQIKIVPMLKRHIIKTNGGIEVQLCAFLTSTLNIEASSFTSRLFTSGEMVSGLFLEHETGQV